MRITASWFRQPHTAHRLPPQGLFLQTQAGAIVNVAEVPCLFRYQITLCLDLLHALLDEMNQTPASRGTS